MWIVRLALRRPYTFIVVSVLILIFGIAAIIRTPKDIFPIVDIPIVSVIWQYAGLPADEFDQRITTFSEYSLSNSVNDIERIESQTVDGVGIIRLYFHPNVRIEAAVAQATASSQSILRRMPPGMLPPIILRYSANSVPIIQMSFSGKDLTETELYNYANFRIRQAIAVVQGVTLPTPYGGKIRQIMVDLDPAAMQAKGVSGRDVNDAITNGVLTLPTGDARIGSLIYRVNVNNTPVLAEALNDIPVKVVNGVVVYVRDVAHVHDGFIPQSNIVRNEGQRSVLLTMIRNGTTSTLDIIKNIRNLMPDIQAAAPKGMKIDLLFDQSVFVRNAIRSVVEEGVLAALLTGLMILLFLGSWRSTFIVCISIPLSILTSIVFLWLIGESLNVMTLGGLALAIGILVDDATVTIENIHRNIAMGKPLQRAVLDGSYQVAIPAFVSTLSICIVFLPVILLVGTAKYLFTPLAYAVVFAVAASYFFSRTLVPVLISFLMKGEMHLYGKVHKTRASKLNWLERYHLRFEKGFLQFRRYYSKALYWALYYRGTVCLVSALIFFSSMLLIPFIGRDFFPLVDASQFRLHVKAASGTRVEVTEEIFGKVEEEIKKVIPNKDIALIIDNVGLVTEPYAMAYGDNATIGSQDGEILVSLNRDRDDSTPNYVEKLRKHLKERFPELTFYFQPADMITQVLNFGLPTPIDVRVSGYNKVENLKIAKELVEKISHVPGAVDVHLHQIVDAPELFLELDRTRLAQLGLKQKDVTTDILLSYSSSAAVNPNFWLDRQSGIPYLISVQTPKYRIDNIDQLMRMPLSSPLTPQSQLLANVATVERRKSVSVTNHLNIQPVYDIYANVQGRDLGGVASDIYKIVDEYNQKMAPGNHILVKGLVETMNLAFVRLGIGFIFAIILVYLIMVINFQSWLDPFIIIMALPGAVAGIIWMLYLTHTTFNVPSLMGAIMSVGVATANSILMVSFANMQLKEGRSSLDSIRAAAVTRLRPILMTALAMIVGMLPMALALGEGGEQNAPLGRAVIGGLLLATLTTLFFVPVMFTFLRHKANKYLYDEPVEYKPPKHQEIESFEE